MFTCIITDHFGPFCGQGGYGSETKIGMSRSPKKAVAIANRDWPYRHVAIYKTFNADPRTGICGGGVPIMRHFQLLKDGKVLKSVWD
jgi:hypothetical protein